MSDVLKVGVIGAGGIAQGGHIPSFQKQPGVEVAAVADPNEAKLGEVVRKFQIGRSYRDYRDLLKEKDIKAVSICSPNFLHREQALAALKAGKHVLCEKPVAMNTAETEEILATARETGLKFMVGFPNRFSATSVFLKKLVEAGQLGEIYFARTGWIRRRGIPGLGGWFTTKSLSGGGPMIDIGVHMLDKAYWLMGAPRPVSVSGVTFQKFAEVATDGGWPPAHTRLGDNFEGTFDVEDLAAAFVRFENGAVLSLEVSWAANAEANRYWHFFGTRAGVREDFSGLKLFGEHSGIQTDTTPSLRDTSLFDEEMKSFLEAVRKDKPVLTTPAEILGVSRIIEGIYRSAAAGAEVKL
ncbi:MAG TPA: Gfo/Idh/MocA family oxidoreductase [bacterium]|uniref:Putative oxidoreductase YcjS n=1 Tax=candidate division TA06 bacterium ADurb.Bin417 TaxID=1852828 RepID=A0A1V5MH69_UNCT6|nr:MAG: putative oxidoreductase YcjS [candidate division TA06 bacterium ADurb.Bin417]HNS47996.1 Gfo/Idh/MocA family oxidoreductase [bacterium]